ncbi:6-phosphogluconolactonase [Corynebacterium kalinowskii]|uniref:6-phosphogluconolactonase n=1 Tax=Corynebacterium kalinowskii TaxID=2675216 RepID=A0A6B8VSU9_9CORY|nr:6-phosphogluconolactonase [Corynebacterium kalinowskii]QGU02075.1 6-phosphogluconolactonase [Corynebacterium kalinowskii]
MQVVNVSDKTHLVARAAYDFVQLIAQAQAGHGLYDDGVARVVLTGGGAGIGLLEELRSLDWAATNQQEDFPAVRVDWSRVHIFFGDERVVPVDHPDSNEGQARAALLDHVAVNPDWIHSYRLGSLTPEDSAAWYNSELEKWAPKGFDLHLLGMGGEGHVNSLFPHTDAVQESSKLVLPVFDSPKPPAERVTLTMPAIHVAQHVWLLVSGAEKAEAAGHVIAGSDYLDWPAAGARGRVSTRLYLAEDATP